MDKDDTLPVSSSDIPSWIGSLPSAFIPNSLKAFDRLIGALIDIPVAKLKQERVRIEARSRSLAMVEDAVGTAVAREAASDPAITDSAASVLVSQDYRRLENSQAVVAAAMDDLKSQEPEPELDRSLQGKKSVIDDDWLNVFERYAEDASSERMQNLWGRVLSGEIRKPGKYSMRTLRFLSEFSQTDALQFAELSNLVFDRYVPRALALPDIPQDESHFIDMEANGLISGYTGMGLTLTLNFDESGFAYMQEGKTAVQFVGPPSEFFTASVITLTPLGMELLSLLPGRDPRTAARKVANAMKTDSTSSAYFCGVVSPNNQFNRLEQFW